MPEKDVPAEGMVISEGLVLRDQGVHGLISGYMHRDYSFLLRKS